MKQDHNRILTTAARAVLAPLGFRQKGRSRIWLADRGFWLSVVEFQPSGFGKGSYLNVAAHWLWSHNSLSFDYSIMSAKPWIAFEDNAQFEGLAALLAERAAEESRKLEINITDLPTLASLLVERHANHESAGRGGGWPAFDAAIAAGIAGDMATARSLFGKANETIGAWRPDLQALIVPYGDALRDASAFAAFIAGKIGENRAAHLLGPLPADCWPGPGKQLPGQSS